MSCCKVSAQPKCILWHPAAAPIIVPTRQKCGRSDTLKRKRAIQARLHCLSAQPSLEMLSQQFPPLLRNRRKPAMNGARS
eukprot:779302-Rhodomonas_salina.4